MICDMHRSKTGTEDFPFLCALCEKEKGEAQAVQDSGEIKRLFDQVGVLQLQLAERDAKIVLWEKIVSKLMEILESLARERTKGPVQ